MAKTVWGKGGDLLLSYRGKGMENVERTRSFATTLRYQDFILLQWFGSFWVSKQSANLLKTPLENVLKVIQHAEKENILDYYPRNEKPQVTFFRERVAAENLSIDLEKFNFRRENAHKRVESSIQYAERKQCRSKQLLAYFGEKRSEKCGICDVCTGRNEADLKEETLQAYQRKITDLLKVEPLSFE